MKDKPITGECPTCKADATHLVLSDMDLSWAFQGHGEERWHKFLRERPAKCNKCGWTGSGAQCLQFTRDEVKHASKH